MRSTFSRPPMEGDDVEVTCWCERQVVIVPLGHVAAGRTDTCGHPECAPPPLEVDE